MRHGNDGHNWMFDAKLGRGVDLTAKAGGGAPPADVGTAGFTGASGEGFKDMSASVAPPDKVGQVQGFANLPGAGNFAAPVDIQKAQNQVATAPPPGAGFFRPAGSGPNPDFVNRRIKEFVRTPQGAMAYAAHQDSMEAGRQVQANEIEKFNVSQKNQTTRSNSVQSAQDKRQQTQIDAQKTAAKTAFDNQVKIKGEEQHRKDQESQIKEAQKAQGVMGAALQMTKTHNAKGEPMLTDEQYKNMQNFSPAIQQGIIDTIQKNWKDTKPVEETKIQNIDGYTVKTGPGTIIKPPVAKPNFTAAASAKMEKELKDKIDSSEFQALPRDEQERIWTEYKSHHENARFKGAGTGSPADASAVPLTGLQKIQEARKGL